MRTIIENKSLCDRFLDVHSIIAEKLKLIKSTRYPTMGVLELLNNEFQGEPFELSTILKLSHRWIGDKNNSGDYGVYYNDGVYVFIHHHISSDINFKYYHHYDVDYLYDNGDGITLVEQSMSIPMNL